MIQRIQSFWLVLSVCCMVLCFVFPAAEYQMEMQNTGQKVEAELNLIAKDNPAMMDQMVKGEPVVEYSQKASGFKTWPLTVLAVLSGVLALVALLMYRNRVRQMRVVAVAFLMNVVYVFLLFFWAVDSYGRTVQAVMEASEPRVTWFAGAYVPIVSVVMLILAHRGIKKDEEKVRAADRIR